MVRSGHGEVAMPNDPRHVSLIAIPESLLGPVAGIFEALSVFEHLAGIDDAVPDEPPFQVEIVGPEPRVTCRANGLSLPTHRTFGELERTDVIIAPSMMVDGGDWIVGRQAATVEWMCAMHARGARLCGACSGALLVAETGLLDGWDATIHPAFAPTFRRNFPDVRLRLESVLVATGRHGELVTSGASAAWHDLILYLVAHYAGPAVAQALARYLLLQWHEHGQGPYIAFSPPTEHGDAAIRRVQDWLRSHYAGVDVLEDMRRLSGLSERSFKRRFKAATGYSPLRYVQHLRVEEAKRRLERTDASTEEVGWAVGYDNTAFFGRLFKRLTGVTPGTYRRRFRVPGFERGAPGAAARAGAGHQAARGGGSTLRRGVSR